MKTVVILTHSDGDEYEMDDYLCEDALRALGYDVKVIPWLTVTDEQLRADIVLPRSVYDYMSHFDKFQAFLDRCTALKVNMHNSVDLLKWNIDKCYLRDIEAWGMPIIPSAIELGEEIDEACLEACGKKWNTSTLVIKPTIGCAGKGMQKLDLSTLSTTAWKSEVNPKMKYLIQPFVEAIYGGEDSVIFIGGKYSHSLRKVPKEGEFKCQEEYGGEVLRIAPPLATLSIACQLTQKIISRFSATAYVRVDFIDGAIGEVECIEPSLYFRTDPPYAAKLLANHIHSLLS